MPLANAISHFTLPVFKTISQHRTLATIKMHVPFASRIFLTNVVNSLPEGIQELDLCFENSWNFRQTSPYFEIPATERPLPALERICLRGLHQRVDSHWYLDHNYPQQHKQQQSPTPISLSPQHETFCLTYVDTMVLPLLQRTPHLCHLILRKYDSGLRDLLQNLAIYCPNLITLELSTHNAGEMYWSPTGMFNSDTSSQLAVQGSFAHLKEFRVEGEWSDLTFRMMAGLVARSKDTLEIAWFDRRNWEDLGNSWMYNAWTGDLEDSWHEDTPRDTGEDQQEDDDDGALTIDHPFYISNKVNWTHCTRLKELVIYKPEGYLLSGDDNHHPDLFLPTSSTSPTSSPSAASGATGEYPSTFNQLEKLRLSIGDVKWQGGPGGYHSEQGLTESTSSSHQRRLQGQEKREHQLGFILQVRNLFGFLKTYYPRLQYLNIEWSVHPLIQDMSLDYAMRLFCQTERDEISDNSSNMDGWCWWGKVTEQDLDWLCLPWSSQSTLIQSTVSANMTAACKQQYANKSQFLMAPSDSKTTTSDFRNNSNDNESWPLGDIYTCRVGRAWKDNLMLPTCTDLWRFRRYTRRDGMDCVWRALGHYSYGYPTVKSTTTMCSCDWSTELEYAAEGLTLTKESYRSGKKRIMRGATSYRQSVIGKHNQIK
ncbi:hypothetical protein BGZ95_001840 [Linnemannia exigua]|uniref:Uncharacterized protein n=1 Tax=Linnemannia exigua TaxID=604196 RepID=A0AAD4DKX6_9FUNG|nr:hypothetical protein BGZ95_001840 [Linnemannia exigua]